MSHDKIINGFQILYGKLGSARVGVGTDVIAASELLGDAYDQARSIGYRFSNPGVELIDPLDFGSGILITKTRDQHDQRQIVLAHMAGRSDSQGRPYFTSRIVLLSSTEAEKIDNHLAWFLTKNRLPSPDVYMQETTLGPYGVVFAENETSREAQCQVLKNVLTASPNPYTYFWVLKQLYRSRRDTRPICFINYDRALMADICLALSFGLTPPKRLSMSIMTTYMAGAISNVRVLFSKAPNYPVPDSSYVINWNDPYLPAVEEAESGTVLAFVHDQIETLYQRYTDHQDVQLILDFSTDIMRLWREHNRQATEAEKSTDRSLGSEGEPIPSYDSDEIMIANLELPEPEQPPGTIKPERTDEMRYAGSPFRAEIDGPNALPRPDEWEWVEAPDEDDRQPPSSIDLGRSYASRPFWVDRLGINHSGSTIFYRFGSGPKDKEEAIENNYGLPQNMPFPELADALRVIAEKSGNKRVYSTLGAAYWLHHVKLNRIERDDQRKAVLEIWNACHDSTREPGASDDLFWSRAASSDKTWQKFITELRDNAGGEFCVTLYKQELSRHAITPHIGMFVLAFQNLPGPLVRDAFEAVFSVIEQQREQHILFPLLLYLLIRLDDHDRDEYLAPDQAHATRLAASLLNPKTGSTDMAIYLVETWLYMIEYYLLVHLAQTPDSHDLIRASIAEYWEVNHNLDKRRFLGRLDQLPRLGKDDPYRDELKRQLYQIDIFDRTSETRFYGTKIDELIGIAVDAFKQKLDVTY